MSHHGQTQHQSKAGAQAPAKGDGALSEVRGDKPRADELANLTRDHRADILVSAGYAGASDEDLKNLKLALEDPQLTMGVVQQVRLKISELAAGREKQTEVYYVAPGCASLTFHGTRYQTGAAVRLTSAEVEQLGSMVTTKKPPSKPDKPSARAAGDYRVTGPGSIWLGGQHKKAGELVYLDAKQAAALGPAVTPAA